jgi:hypothetical protein
MCMPSSKLNNSWIGYSIWLKQETRNNGSSTIHCWSIWYEIFLVYMHTEQKSCVSKHQSVPWITAGENVSYHVSNSRIYETKQKTDSRMNWKYYHNKSISESGTCKIKIIRHTGTQVISSLAACRSIIKFQDQPIDIQHVQ